MADSLFGRKKRQDLQATNATKPQLATDLPPSASDNPATSDKAPGKAGADQSPGLQMLEETVAAGRAGERNLRIEWIDVWIGNCKPCYFNVITAEGNELEVEMQQLAYRKNYAGVGMVKTDILPIAPIGSHGRTVARDLTTGEVLEQKWVWNNLGGQSFFGWLFATVRKLFVG